MKHEEIQEEMRKLFGDKIYLVGGSVRDLILNNEPKDYDFCTHLRPVEMEAILKRKSKKAYGIGKRFGTIGVRIKGDFIEITTFRTEQYEEGNRKPIVNFVSSISEDLSRRDFTMNAMAMRNGKTIDPYGGKQHLKGKVIKCVGNASERFNEDPLRMLRACRFASQLSFSIHPLTLQSMKKKAHRILNVSKERWCMELDKLLMGDNVVMGMVYLFESGLLKFMIPELYLQKGFNQRTKHHKYNLDSHTVKVISGCPKDINLRWAALLHDIAKPFIYQDKGNRYIYPMHEKIGAEFVEKIAKYLKWSNERRLKVKDLVLNHLDDNCPLRKYDNMAK